MAFYSCRFCCSLISDHEENAHECRNCDQTVCDECMGSWKLCCECCNEEETDEQLLSIVDDMLERYENEVASGKTTAQHG